MTVTNISVTAKCYHQHLSMFILIILLTFWLSYFSCFFSYFGIKSAFSCIQNLFISTRFQQIQYFNHQPGTSGSGLFRESCKCVIQNLSRYLSFRADLLLTHHLLLNIYFYVNSSDRNSANLLSILLSIVRNRSRGRPDLSSIAFLS